MKIFNVSKHFSISNPEICFNSFSEYFGKWLCPLREENSGKSVLHQVLFTNPSGSKELGNIGRGEYVKNHPSTMMGIYKLIQKDSRGEKTDLLGNGVANIFYVYDASNILRVVAMCQNVPGWYGYAGPLDYPGFWPDGCRVFVSIS